MKEMAMEKKIDDFFGLWSCIMGAGGENGEDDPLGQLLDRIFQKEYKDGREAMKWLDDELSKIKGLELKKSLRDAVENLITKAQYFHLAVGFAIGGIYDVTTPEARAQIDYLRQTIHEAGVFRMVAKFGEHSTSEVSHPPSPSSNVVGTEEKDQKKGSMPQDDYFTLPQAATWLGVSPAWLYKKVNAGVVPHRKIGRMIRFHQKDIAELMNDHKTGPISPKGHGEVGKRPQNGDDMSETWLTAQQVADLIGVSRSWVLRKAKAGIAPHVRIGGVIRFSESVIETWMKNHGIKGALKI